MKSPAVTSLLDTPSLRPLLAQKLVLLLASACSIVHAADKNYLHFTFKAFLDEHDRNAVEWAWVTLVEIPREKAFPNEAW